MIRRLNEKVKKWSDKEVNDSIFIFNIKTY